MTMPAAPKIAYRDLVTLKPDPANARTHSNAQVERLAALIRRFGWTVPILVDDMVRAGHGRCAAAARIYEEGGTIYMAPGAEFGGAEVPKGKVPVLDCTGWSEEMRRAYNLADNRIAEQAEWDVERLTAQLADLAAADFAIGDIGFHQDDIDAMLAGLAGSGSPTPPAEFPEFNESIDTEHRCPKCNYTWSGKAS